MKAKFKTIVLFAFLSLFSLYCSLAVRKEYNQKMKAEIKVELQASGLFDCKKKTLQFVEVSTGDVAYMKTDGVCLIGSDKIYPVKNHAWINIEYGDSIYVANNLAFSYMPTVEHVRHELPPTESVFNIILGITAAIWIWLVTLLMLLYLQRCSQK